MAATILTVSGAYFPLLSPRPSDIRIGDVAHALANVCRFAGHTREFYSVAQHSVLVSEIVPREDALAALLHDAAEAYVGDVTRPLKPYLADYGAIEVRIMESVLRAFDLPTEMPASVKYADRVLLATEQRDLMPEHGDIWPILEGIQALPTKIKPWSPSLARTNFLVVFEALFRERCHAD